VVYNIFNLYISTKKISIVIGFSFIFYQVIFIETGNGIFVRVYPLGNVWLTDSYQDYGSIKSPAQLKKLVEQIKTFAEQPLFISIDAEG